MAQWHLKEIENHLEQSGWKVLDKVAGNDYDISETWTISRNIKLKIDFTGLDDMVSVPVEKAYGCVLRGRGIDLYFHKKGHVWKQQLRQFVEALDLIVL